MRGLDLGGLTGWASKLAGVGGAVTGGDCVAVRLPGAFGGDCVAPSFGGSGAIGRTLYWRSFGGSGAMGRIV